VSARPGNSSTLSTSGRHGGNLTVLKAFPIKRSLEEDAGEHRPMSKPAKTAAELIAMARAELKVHADCPEGVAISVIPAGDSWEFRASADEATAAKPGYPECVAMLVQIGDHLAKHYDLTE
jgi:hypothetical protein